MSFLILNSTSKSYLDRSGSRVWVRIDKRGEGRGMGGNKMEGMKAEGRKSDGNKMEGRKSDGRKAEGRKAHGGRGVEL